MLVENYFAPPRPSITFCPDESAKMRSSRYINIMNYAKKTMKHKMGNQLSEIACSLIKPYLMSSFIQHYSSYDERIILNSYLIKFMKHIYLKSYRKSTGNSSGIPNFVVDDGKYFFVLDKMNFMLIEVITKKYDISVNDVISGVRFTFYGKDHSKWNSRIYMDYFYYEKKVYFKNISNSDSISIINMEAGAYSKRYDKVITINDVIHPEKMKVLSLLKKFRKSQSIYDKYKLGYHIGLVLYGEPGTGKSTFIKLIASELMMPIYYMDLNYFHNKKEDDNIGGIYVFEELDTMFKPSDDLLTRTGSDKSSNDSINDKSAIRNFILDIDKVSNGSIIIVTTNHIESIDPAVIRDGRFDIKMKFDNFNSKESEDMIHKFDETLESMKDYIEGLDLDNINPSHLENIIRQKKISDLDLKYNG